MISFVLQPCRLREDRFVVAKQPRESIDWRAAVKRFAPSGAPQALLVLQQLRPQAFLGLVRSASGPTSFVLLNQDRSGRLGRILERDPTFASRLLEVYRVESVARNASVAELPGRAA